MSRRLPSELAIVLLSLVTVATWWRLFEGWAFLVPLGTAVVASHLLSALLRRAGLGALTTALLSLVGGVLFLTLTRYRATTWYGLPTGRTWEIFSTEIVDAWEVFPTTSAPVPATGGYLAASILAVWIMANLSDDLALRAAATWEAIAPQALLFVVGSALAGDRLRFPAVALWLPVALVTVAVLRADRPDGAGWFGGERRGATAFGVRTAALVGAFAVAVGSVAGPALPGAGAEPLIDTHRASTNRRTTISPLVDIRSRLVNQSDTLLFTVAAREPAYWRMTSLENFDGQIWRSAQSYGSAGGDLQVVTPAEFSHPLTQEVTIATLDSVWLPVAFSPFRVSDPSVARYDPTTASLLARTDGLVQGTSYTVVSRLPTLTAQDVAAASEPIPESIAKTYLELPADFGADLVAVAQAQAGTSPNPYERALSLQNWFRTFTYDLNGPSGHSTDAMRQFLIERRGYCEQFAGTFAAFARAVGLPSRVAVGFTPGDLDPAAAFQVKGRHAHAWPEVYFTGIGWVAFEPTPGRGAPGAEGYTGVPAAQDSATPAPPPGQGAAPGTSAAPADRQIEPDVRSEDLSGLVAGGDSSADDPTGGAPGARSWLDLVWWLALGVLGLAIVWAALSPIVGRRVWAYRRNRATDPRSEVLVTWRQTLGVLRRNGYRVQPAETPSEVARRLADDLGPARELLSELADQTTHAAFGPEPVDPEVAARGVVAVERLERVLRRRAPWRQRLRIRLDPRLAVAG